MRIRKCRRCGDAYTGIECENCALGPAIPLVMHPDSIEPSASPFELPYTGHLFDRRASSAYYRSVRNGDSAGPAIGYASIGLNSGSAFWNTRAGSAWDMTPGIDDLSVVRRGGRRASERSHRQGSRS